jgi:cytochrome c-type biogenesis protein CcmE
MLCGVNASQSKLDSCARKERIARVLLSLVTLASAFFLRIILEAFEVKEEYFSRPNWILLF